MKNTWVFPAIESAHLVGLALAVGTVILLDLVHLGWISAFEADLNRWTRRGWALLLVTGPILFLADTSRYLHNTAFLIKLTLLIAAFGFHHTLRRKQLRWTAVLSILLWTSVVLAARLIADFDAV